MKRIVICLLSVVMLVTMMLPADITLARGRGGGMPRANNETTIESPLAANFDYSICSSCSRGSRISVTFTDKSRGGAEPYRYTWDFGDGRNSTRRTPRHSYAGAGNYTVTLTITDRAGNVASTSEAITLGVAATTNVEPVSSNSTKGVALTWPRCNDGCTANDATIIDAWLVADGGCTPGEDNTAELWVTFDVNRDKGPWCVVSVMDIYVDGVLTYDEFTTAIGDLPGSGQSDRNIGDIIWPCGSELEVKDVHVQWMINDGTCEQDCKDYKPSKCWDIPGPFIVHTPLVADFEFNNVCFCNNTTFTDTTTGGAEPYASWYWNFSDGSNSTVQNPKHHYASTGTYNVTLTVTDHDGITDSQSYSVPVYPNPSADAGPDKEVCQGSSVVIGGNPTASGGTAPYIYTWSPATGLNNTHVANPGASPTSTTTYTVTVTDDNGCTDSDTVEVTVSPLPEADFYASDTEPCAGTEIDFFDDSTGTYDSWFWDFGDGTNSTAQNPSHTYASAGTYTVSLTISNGCGDDTETKTEYITCLPTPVADFTADQTSGCAPLTVVFTDLSTGDITSWSWSFPGGNPSGATGPGPHQVTYNNPGTYTVNLTISSACGDDTETKIAYITVRDCTPEPPAGGGGGGCPRTDYLTVDWEGCNTSRPLYSNDKLAVDLLGPSFDLTHSLFLGRGTHAPVVDERTYYLIVVRELEQIPATPENTVALVVFNVTPAGAEFDRDILLTLGLNQTQLPANTLNVTMAYYDDVNGVWETLDYEAGGPNGVAELTLSAPINHFSIYGVLAELGPTQQPAHFVASGLTVVPAVEKISAFVTKIGEVVTITANVANDGGQEGTYDVVLKLNGETVDTTTVTIAAGQSKQVSFTRSGLDYGQYDVEVAGLADEFTVSRTITWWLIILLIVAFGLIIWGALWGRKKRRKAQQET